jgi:DNA polymerase kappa
MISTSNYVARKYGVRSAMPGFIAKKLCPELVFVSCNFDKYKAASQAAQEAVREFQPSYTHSGGGLDEFYVDITDVVRAAYRKERGLEGESDQECDGGEASILALREVAVRFVHSMRRRITEKTGGLTCSAGIANNFMLAKICADKNKPDGQFSLPPDRNCIVEFMRNLPCRKVQGIGKVSEKILSDLGMTKIGEVEERLSQLYFVFSPIMCTFLTRVCLGLDRSECEGASATPTEGSKPDIADGPGQKSLSCERTFTASSDTTFLYSKLYDICHSISPKLQEKNLRPRTMTLKIKAADFEMITRSASAAGRAVVPCGAESLFEMAKKILDDVLPLRIRLIGVSMSNFMTDDKSSSSDSRGNILSYFASGRHEPAGSERTCSDGTQRQDFVDLVDSDEGGAPWPDDHFNDHGSSSANEQLYICPVCMLEKRATLDALNRHLDECLSIRAAEEMLGPEVALTDSYPAGGSGADGTDCRVPVADGKQKRPLSNKLGDESKQKCRRIDDFMASISHPLLSKSSRSSKSDNKAITQCTAAQESSPKLEYKFKDSFS